MPLARLHAIIHGRVQGVFFRDSARSEARRLGVGGWVRNNPDGTVELEAVGARAVLDELHDWLETGPPAARVDRVESDWGEASGPVAEFRVTG